MKIIFSRSWWFLFLCVVMLSSCASEQPLRAHSPEAHTRGFFKSIFQNPWQ